MAIRVTSVSLYALHTGKTSFTGYGDGKYDHDYTAFDGAVDGTSETEIGVELENVIASGDYFLAGFEAQENVAANGNYDLNAYAPEENVAASGVYSIEAYVQQDGGGTASFALNAFVILDGKYDAHYDLSTYGAVDQVFGSEYELQVYLLAQGFTDGLYDVDAYVDFLMQAVSSYDLNVFEARDNIAAQGSYDLNAWEAREVAVAAHYALLTFVQSTGYLNAEFALSAYEAFQQRYGVHYSIDAYQLLQGYTDHSYDINVLTLAQLQEGGHYSLDVYQAFNGFADATAVLNAYQQADGFTDGQYGVSIYLAKTGFVDSQYAIEALAALTGYVDGTYLLDTTQELFTWVLNHNTGAPSRYENFDFDAFAQIGEDYLAARGDGIYLLEGDDDNGIDIDAIATIGRTDFDEPSMKRVTAAFLGLNSAGQAHLTLRTDQGITSGPYKLRQSPAASTTERAKFARGLKSRYWEVDIENADGGDLQIKTAELETIILGPKRRLKK
jgi:hypothetical protein